MNARSEIQAESVENLMGVKRQIHEVQPISEKKSDSAGHIGSSSKVNNMNPQSTFI